MDGLHGESMTQHEGNPLLSTEISQPIPGEDTCDTDDDILARGRDGREKRVWGCWHVTVNQNLPNLVQDAEVHRAGVQVDATIKFVRLSGESHEVSSASRAFFPRTSIPLWYVEEGASISIKSLQRTRHTAAAPLNSNVSRRKYGIRSHIRAQFDIESKSQAGTSIPIPGRCCHG